MAKLKQWMIHTALDPDCVTSTITQPGLSDLMDRIARWAEEAEPGDAVTLTAIDSDDYGEGVPERDPDALWLLDL